MDGNLCVIHHQLSPHLTLRDLYYLCLTCKAINLAYRDHIREIEIFSRLNERGEGMKCGDRIYAGGDLEYIISGDPDKRGGEISMMYSHNINLIGCSGYMLYGRIIFVDGISTTELTPIKPPKRPGKHVMPKAKPELLINYCSIVPTCTLARISEIMEPYLSYKMVRALTLVNRDCHAQYGRYLYWGSVILREMDCLSRKQDKYLFGDNIDRLLDLNMGELALEARSIQVYHHTTARTRPVFKLSHQLYTSGITSRKTHYNKSDTPPDCNYIYNRRIVIYPKL